MPAKKFRKSRPDAFLTYAAMDITEGDLVRFDGVHGIERDQCVVPADEDWEGLLYVAIESKRRGSNVFVARYHELLNADVPDPVPPARIDGTVVFLADGGKLTFHGVRPVGVLAAHDEKGPIALLEPGACVVVSLLRRLYNMSADAAENLDARVCALEAAATAVVEAPEVVEALPEPKVKTPRKPRTAE